MDVAEIAERGRDLDRASGARHVFRPIDESQDNASSPKPTSRGFTQAQPGPNIDPTLPVDHARMLRHSNHVTQEVQRTAQREASRPAELEEHANQSVAYLRCAHLRRMVALLVALAVFSVGCGGGEETASSVASLADVEVAATPTPDIVEATPEEATETQDPESAETSADSENPVVEQDATGDPELTDEDMALAFVACVREAGIDEMPDPTVRADGTVELLPVGQRQVFQNPDFEEAAEGCVDLIEDATFFSEAPDISTLEDDLLAFAQCLRENGVDVDDPDLSKFVPGQGARMFGDDFDPQDPANADAIAACSSLLPNAGGN